MLGILPLSGRHSAELSRVIHLSLAGPCAAPRRCKARFGLSKDMTWDTFLRGVQDRLQLSAVPPRIETAAGVAIASVAELLHRDNIV
eukprot:4567847-Prymnesium_polylepis.1